MDFSAVRERNFVGVELMRNGVDDVGVWIHAQTLNVCWSLYKESP